jgi:hypothetical protein
MNDFILSVDNELKSAGNTPTGNHLKTGDIRKLSARFFKEMKGKPTLSGRFYYYY